MEKNINDWDINDSRDTAYYRTGKEGFLFSIELAENGDGLLTLLNNGQTRLLDSTKISRPGFRWMYCDDLIREFFEQNKLVQV